MRKKKVSGPRRGRLDVQIQNSESLSCGDEAKCSQSNEYKMRPSLDSDDISQKGAVCECLCAWA